MSRRRCRTATPTACGGGSHPGNRASCGCPRPRSAQSGLLRLKSRELYDLPPFLSLPLDQIFEFFRRSTDHYRAQFAKFAFNLGVAEDAVYLLIELANDLHWYFTLRADSIPATRFVAGQRLADCREIWQCWCAFACCNCERSQISSFDIRYRTRCGVKHHLNLVPHESGERRRNATKRNMGHLHASHHLEQLARNVLRRAKARRRHVELSWIGFGEGDKLGNCFCGKCWIDLHHQRCADQTNDGCNIPDEIEFERRK